MVLLAGNRVPAKVFFAMVLLALAGSALGVAVAPHCPDLCKEPIDRCAADAACLRALTCLETCNEDFTCIAACIKPLTEGSNSRKLLSAVRGCVEPCESENECRDYTTYEQCPTDDCSWVSRCQPKEDRCAAGNSTTCTKWNNCAWDSLRHTCYSKDHFCYENQIHPDQCTSDSRCVSNYGCGARYCPECTEKQVACYLSASCFEILTCFQAGVKTETECNTLKAANKVGGALFDAASNCVCSVDNRGDAECNPTECSHPCAANEGNCIKAHRCMKNFVIENGKCDATCKADCTAELNNATLTKGLLAYADCVSSSCGTSVSKFSPEAFCVANGCKTVSDACNANAKCKEANFCLKRCEYGDLKCQSRCSSVLADRSVERQLFLAVAKCMKVCVADQDCKANKYAWDSCNSKNRDIECTYDGETCKSDENGAEFDFCEAPIDKCMENAACFEAFACYASLYDGDGDGNGRYRRAPRGRYFSPRALRNKALEECRPLVALDAVALGAFLAIEKCSGTARNGEGDDYYAYGSDCGDTCTEVIEACRNDTTCVPAFDCATTIYSEFYDCDTTCQVACSAKATTTAGKALFSQAIGCIRDQCVFGVKECIPYPCQDLRSECSLYKSCSDVVDCYHAVTSTAGQCDADCLAACASRVKADNAPAELIPALTTCLADNINYCINSQFQSECGSQCQAVDAQCGGSAACIAGLECFGYQQDCRDVECRQHCLSFTKEGSQDRKWLVASMMCRQDCDENIRCDNRDACNANNPVLSCAFQGSCELKKDPCAAKETAADCTVNCQWDAVTASCQSAKNPCKFADESECYELDSICSFEKGCKSSTCFATCRKPIYDCHSFDKCVAAYLCMEESWDFEKCKPLAGSGSSLTAFNVYVACASACTAFSNEDDYYYYSGSGDSSGSGSGSDYYNYYDNYYYNSYEYSSSFCPECTDATSACKADANCNLALILSGQYFYKYGFCGSDCLKFGIDTYSLSDAETALLNSTLMCYNQEKCASCDHQCIQPISACNNDPVCASAFKCMQSKRSKTTGRCTGSCITDCFGSLPASYSRILLSEVASCQLRCGAQQECGVSESAKSCSAFSLTRSQHNANCQWNPWCAPKSDQCLQYFTEKQCEGISGGSGDSPCKWDGSLCRARESDCYEQDQDGCNADSSCRWSPVCTSDRTCVDTCSGEEELNSCFRSNTCLKAWLCLQTARQADSTQVERCAAESSLQTQTDGSRESYYRIAKCYSNCKVSEVCDARCASALQNCAETDGCSGYFNCVDGCQGPNCATGCLNGYSGAALTAAFATATCYETCQAAVHCSAFSAESTCNFDTSCSWSSRCVASDSKACRALSEDVCVSESSGLCVWDDFSSTCIASADSCYSSDEITSVPATNLLGEPTLVLVPANETCAEGCASDAECIPDDRCDRACYNTKLNCFKVPACAAAAVALQRCGGSDSCRSEVLQFTEASVITLLDLHLSCVGNCHFNKCGASCSTAKAACLANTACKNAFNCIAARYGAGGRAGADSYTACAGSLATTARNLFKPAVACIVQNCDPHFLNHPSCQGVENALFLSEEIQSLVCAATDCVPATADAAAVSCAFTPTDRLCGCPSTVDLSTICDLNADTCVACCESDFKTCQGDTPDSATVTKCYPEYNACIKQCRSDFYRPEAVKGKVIFSNSLTFDYAANLALDLALVRKGIWNALNNEAVTPNDIFIEITSKEDKEDTSRRATSLTVLLTYVIRVPAEVAGSVQGSIENADLTTGLSNAGVAADAVEQTIDEIAEATTSAPTEAPSARYSIVTIVGTLPTGATMTEEQKTALAAAYLEAYQFPFDTPITVTVGEDGVVVITVTIDHEPTENDLAPKVLPISYTDASNNEVEDFVVTSDSQANASASSAEDLSTGGIIGVVIGAFVLVILLVLVVLLIRSRRKPRAVSHS